VPERRARTARRASVPSFTIVIPTYQAASTIGDAVESALKQTCAALEVIVCDDGSTDDLAGALAPYRESIRLIRKENGGVASALNCALGVARGDYVAILNADDVYAPDRLKALGELVTERPDLDIATTDAYIEADGKVVDLFSTTTPFIVDDQRAGILRRCFVGGWPALRRSRVVAIGGWDESLRIGEDWDLWLRLILEGSRAGFVDEPLMSYRLRAGSLTSNRIENLRARVALLEKARSHPSLTRRERRILGSSISWQRSRLQTEIERRAREAGQSQNLSLRVARLRESLAYARFRWMEVARGWPRARGG
jgi:glycosyltransferase involved in cell wall biosynthesis